MHEVTFASSELARTGIASDTHEGEGEVYCACVLSNACDPFKEDNCSEGRMAIVNQRR